MFYASEQDQDSADTVADSNTYRPFKTIDSTVVTRILDEVQALGQPDEEGEPLPMYLSRHLYPQNHVRLSAP